MTPTEQLDKLLKAKQDLQQKTKQIEQKIREAKNRQNAEERKKDTRRKILVGSLILRNVEAGIYPQEKLIHALDEFLTQPKDRELFGLSSEKYQ